MSNLRYVVCADTLYMDGTFEKLLLQLSLHIGQAPHAVTISPLHQIPSFWRPQSVPNSHMEGGVVGTSFPWRGKRGPKSEAKKLSCRNSLRSRVKQVVLLYATTGRPSRPLTPGIDRKRKQISSSERGQRWPPL